MPIPLPHLDDRRWADLTEEGRALIPLYAPEWTDHNASDPGITLMELFAWIAEMDIYQVNRVPDRHKRKFLELVGITAYPPQASRAVVGVQPKDPADVDLPLGIEIVGEDAAGSPVWFRARHGVTATPARLVAVQSFDGATFRDQSGRLQRGEPLSLMGAAPASGAALYLGFDRALPTAKQISLYFLTDAAEELSSPHHSARISWQVLASGSTWAAAAAHDETRSLTQSGMVRLTISPNMIAAPLGAVSASLYWVRATLASGEFDAPPAARFIIANALELDQSVSATGEWNLAAGASPSGPLPVPGETTGIHLTIDAQGRIATLAFDPAEREGRFKVLQTTPSLILEAVRAATGTGGPNQVVRLKDPPTVQAGSHILTLEGADWRTWHRRDNFDRSGPADNHFLLDCVTGEVTFGDGEHGRVPPDGSQIFARYRTTLAGHGNIAAGKIGQIVDSAHNRAIAPATPAVTISNPAPSSGGAAAETLAHAIGRAITLREAPLRAVTTQDFETLALATPGVRLARAGVWADVYPGFDCFPAAGIVTVILVPAMPVLRPFPSAGLIRAVAAHLNPRRIIGTRIEVIGPGYLEVKVQARVRALPGASRSQVRADVLAALNAFLDPLTGGPGRTGWPFGRDVYRSEILQAIDRTLGVDRVESLALFADGCGPNCGNICLRPEFLVTAGAHEIEVR